MTMSRYMRIETCAECDKYSVSAIGKPDACSAKRGVRYFPEGFDPYDGIADFCELPTEIQTEEGMKNNER